MTETYVIIVMPALNTDYIFKKILSTISTSSIMVVEQSGDDLLALYL